MRIYYLNNYTSSVCHSDSPFFVFFFIVVWWLRHCKIYSFSLSPFFFQTFSPQLQHEKNETPCCRANCTFVLSMMIVESTWWGVSSKEFVVESRSFSFACPVHKKHVEEEVTDDFRLIPETRKAAQYLTSLNDIQRFNWNCIQFVSFFLAYTNKG